MAETTGGFGLIPYIFSFIFRESGGAQTQERIRGVTQAVQEQEKAVKSATGAQKPLIGGTKEATQGMGDFERAMRRALIVVPVWMAFRLAYGAVVNTIREGAKYWVETEEMFTKASLVIHSSTKTVGEATEELRTRITALARETGREINILTDAFYRFGTIGIDFDVAMSGAAEATRAAVATFGDVEIKAKSAALAYSLLGEKLKETGDTQKDLSLLFAKQTALWKDNLMEADEFDRALERFLPTAKQLNMSYDETIALLATLHSAGIRAERSGRLLRTSAQQLMKNMGELATMLGIYVNPYMDNFYNIMTKVIGKIYEMREASGAVAPEIIEAFQELFGGVRGGEPAMAIASMFEKLNENFKRINTEGGKNIDLIEEIIALHLKQYETVNKTLPEQIKRFREMRKEIGQAFVMGAVGGDKFNESLSRINDTMETLIPIAKTLGENIGEIVAGLGLATANVPLFAAGMAMMAGKAELSAIEKREKATSRMVETIKRALKGLEPLSVVNKLLTDLVEGGGLVGYEDVFKQELEPLMGLNKEDIIRRLQEVEEQLIKDPTMYLRLRAELEIDKEAIRKMASEIESEVSKGVPIPIEPPKIAYSTKTMEDLKALQESVKYTEMQLRGADDLQISYQKLTDYIKQQVELFNSLDSVQDGRIEALNEEEIITMALAKNWDGIAETTQKVIFNDKVMLEIGKLLKDVEEARLETRRQLEDKMLEVHLGRLKALGYDNLQIEIERLKIMKQRGDLAPAILEQELKIQKEINDSIAEYSGALQSTLKDAFKDLFKGEIGVEDFFKRLSDKYFDTIADAMAEMFSRNIMQMTGWGESFGEMMTGIKYAGTPIEQAYQSGSYMTYNAIVSGFSDGVGIIMGGIPGGQTAGMPGIGRTFLPVSAPGGYYGGGMGGYGGAGGGGFGNIFGRLFGGGGGGWSPRQIEDMVSGGRGGGGFFGNIFGKLFGGAGGGGFGNMMMGGLMGYAQGGWAGAGMGILGNMLMSVNPVLGGLFMLFSGLFGGKKQTVTQSSWQPQEAPEVLPLMLAQGIPPLPSMYPLPESRYFAGRQRGAGGGQTTIQINIDKIEGTTDDIADKIANKVADIYNRELNRGLFDVYP